MAMSFMVCTWVIKPNRQGFLMKDYRMSVLDRQYNILYSEEFDPGSG